MVCDRLAANDELRSNPQDLEILGSRHDAASPATVKMLLNKAAFWL